MKSHHTRLASNKNGLAKNGFAMMKRYLSVAFALAALATVGSAPAFAQSFGYNGSPLPGQYDGAGGKVTGSEVQAPTTVHHRTAQSPHPQAAQSSHSRAAPQG
jgi:hypothetical protein